MNLRDFLHLLWRYFRPATGCLAYLVMVVCATVWVEGHSQPIPMLKENAAWGVPAGICGIAAWLLRQHARRKAEEAKQRETMPSKRVEEAMTYEGALRKVVDADPMRPRGWFCWLHMTKWAWYPPKLREDLRDEWRLIGRDVARDPSLMGDELLKQVRRHGWRVGQLELRHLVQAAWDSANERERAQMLAGLSEDYRDLFEKDPEDRERDSAWIVSHLGEVRLTAEEVLEIACNAIYQQDEVMLTAALENGKELLNAVMERKDGPDWEEDLKKLSNRLIDMVLEASILRCWPPGASAALKNGADPNLHLWELEDCRNEHYTSVGWLIGGGRAMGPETRIIFDMLLKHPGFKAGATHSKALIAAFRLLGKKELAWQLIGKGVTFQSEIKPEWLKGLPKDQEYDWNKSSLEAVKERRDSFGRACKLAEIFPVLSCHEASWFDDQSWMAGATWNTAISIHLYDIHLKTLERCAEAGLPLKLTFLDYLILADARSAAVLEWLMEKWETPPEVREQAMQILMEKN